jgi:hypothetical protein
MFPNLKERRNSQGTRLSGGEQQMLAMARVLRTGARLLLLDEISEGLAPVIVQKLGEVIRKLKERDYTIVLVEQNFRFAAPLADRMFIVEHGQVMAEIAQGEIEEKQACCRSTLGSDVCPAIFHTRRTMMKRKLLALAISASLLPAAGSALAQAKALGKISGDVVKIGVLTDMSGVYSALGGKGSVLGARWPSRISRPSSSPSSRSNWSPPTTRTRPTSVPTRCASGTTPRAWTWSPTC